MEIKNPKYVTKQGYPLLSVKIDGIIALIPYEQKAIEYDLIFLGPQFEKVVPLQTLPADKESNRLEPQRIRGFTKNKTIVKLYKDFRTAVDNGEFKNSE